MNDWALYLGVAALLCAACSLLGAELGMRWGVDPSRRMPGARPKGAARRLRLGRIAGCFAMLPAALWMSAVADEAWGRKLGAAACAAYALLCAMLGFCALFTSVRHDAADMACVCEEELFPAAGKVRDALGVLAAVFSAGTLLMSLIRDGQVDHVSNGMLFAFSLAVWPMLGMQIAAQHHADVIRSERQMLPAAAGGTICAALVAILSILPGVSLPLSDVMHLTLLALVWLSWIASYLTLCCLGGCALRGLLVRPLARKKKSALLYTLLCLAASVPLALYASAWLFVAGTVLCAVCAVMDALACWAWLRRIGRSFFS